MDSRHKYHAAKRDWYDQAAKEAGERAESTDNYASNNPVTSLKQSADNHRRKAAYFLLLQNHVPIHEIFQLEESDLTRLELVDRYL